MRPTILYTTILYTTNIIYYDIIYYYIIYYDILYTTILYTTIVYTAILYTTIFYILRYYILLYYILLYYILLYYILRYYILLYYILLYYILLYYILLYYILLYYILLYYILRYYILRYYILLYYILLYYILRYYILLGMGIENRFLFRTGAESTNSLESLASLLNDSAYRFRWRQMRHDVTHHAALFWFRPRQTWRRRGRSALKLGCILRVKTTILPLATVVKFQCPQRGELPPICRNIWPHSMEFICRNVTCLIHYEVATQVNHRQPGGCIAGNRGGGVHRRQTGGGGASPATGGGASPATGGPPTCCLLTGDRVDSRRSY